MKKNKLSESPEWLPEKKQKVSQDIQNKKQEEEEEDKILTEVYNDTVFEVCKDVYYEVCDWEEGKCREAILKWIRKVHIEKLLTKQEVSEFYNQEVKDLKKAIRAYMDFCLRRMKQVNEIYDQENNSKES